MADEGKRFEIQIVLTIKEMKDGTPTDFFGNTVNYHDLGYDGVLLVEQALLGALAQLGNAGIGKAVALGLGERLQAMGLGPQVAAFIK